MNVATMMANVTEVPSDSDWHDHAVLLSELATLNARIARYVTRILDADAKRGKPVSPADKAALRRTLADLGARLLERSRRQPAINATTTPQTPLPRDGQAHGPIRRSRLLKPPAFRQESGQTNKQEGR